MKGASQAPLPHEHEGAPRQRAYLLRMWQVPRQRSGRPLTWRFSLVDPETEQKRGFSDLAELTAFLRVEMAEQRAHTEDLEPKAGAKGAPVSPTG